MLKKGKIPVPGSQVGRFSCEPGNGQKSLQGKNKEKNNICDKSYQLLALIIKPCFDYNFLISLVVFVANSSSQIDCVQFVNIEN